ncbi:hypothetical protein BT69DRAFT_1318760 [Atractiella rhizophila]|nr:hypothetical protein BT69DRAFT_1318760 [Atractiella rhizophila]
MVFVAMDAANVNGKKSGKRPADAAMLAAQGRMPPGAKRPRTNRACEQCRKQKSRCEPSASVSKACHRCFTLTIPCSFLTLPDEPSTAGSSPPIPPSTSDHNYSLPSFTPESRQGLVDILWRDSSYRRLKGEEDEDSNPDTSDWADVPTLLNGLLLRFETQHIKQPVKAVEGGPTHITAERRAQWDEIYEQLFSPLFSASSKAQARAPSPFLQAVRHLLASQQCTNATAAETSFLTSLVNQGAFRAISANPATLNEEEVLDIIKAFLLLSEWIPANPTLPPTGLGDGSMFRDAAVKMCKQVGLDRLELQAGMNEEERDKTVDKILLWLDVCSVEALQNIVHGHSCGSQEISRLENILLSLSLPQNLFLTLRNRMRYLRITLDGLAQVDDYTVELTAESIQLISKRMTNSIFEMEEQMRFFNRLTSLSNSLLICESNGGSVAGCAHEMVLSYTGILQMGCLLLLQIKPAVCFRLLPTQIPKNQADRSEAEKALVELLDEKMVFFGRQLMSTVDRLVLLTYNCQILMSLPDNTLHFVAFAVFIAIKINFNVYRHDRPKLLKNNAFFETIQIQENIIESLCDKFATAGSYRPERLLTRYARLIRGMLHLWKNREEILREKGEANSQASEPQKTNQAPAHVDPTLSLYVDFSYAFAGMLDYPFPSTYEGSTNVDWLQSILPPAVSTTNFNV